MGIQLSWYNSQKTVLYHQFSGRWTWDDLFRAKLEGQKWIDESGNTVHLVFDMNNVRLLPSGSMTHVRDLLTHPAPNVGKTFIASNSPFVSMMLTVVKRANNAVTNALVVIPSGESIPAFLSRYFADEHFDDDATVATRPVMSLSGDATQAKKPDIRDTQDATQATRPMVKKARDTFPVVRTARTH